MDYQKLIGLPIEKVKTILDEENKKYTIKESSNIQKEFDSLLVVNVREINNGYVELTTDKFLLKI